MRIIEAVHNPFAWYHATVASVSYAPTVACECTPEDYAIFLRFDGLRTLDEMLAGDDRDAAICAEWAHHMQHATGPLEACEHLVSPYTQE